MISKKDRKKLKKLLKDDYTAEVSSMLEEKGIRNQYGNPYSRQYIRVIFSGTKENLTIEKAIFDLYNIRKEEIETLKTLRNNILNEKTEAPTSVL